jgi:ADP-heptose:LPS heptosyltransferase/GT2 family glycosyltransferase
MQPDRPNVAFSIAGTHQDTHAVVVLGGVHESTVPDSLSALAKTRPGFTWTAVDTSRRGAWRVRVRRLGGGYISLPGETNIPRALNVGAERVHRSSYILLLHDDVTLPEGKVWVRDLTLPFRVDPGIGIVVPVLSGTSHNSSQKLRPNGAGVPYCHTTEYVSSAVMCFSREAWDSSGGFNDDMEGYDWWQVELQFRLALLGRSAAVVPSVCFDHAGKGTYRDAGRVGVSKLFHSNMERFTAMHGIPLEHRARPCLARIPVGPVDGLAVGFVVDSAAGVGEALGVVAACDDSGEEIGQVSFVDMSGSADVWNMSRRVGLGRWRYALGRSADPMLMLPDTVSTKRIRIYDLRTGHAIPAESEEGPRIRVGTGFRIPQQMTEFHMSMLYWHGIGDTFMMTPAIHAFKKAFPWISIHVHHSWDAGKVLLNNPDISCVHQYDPVANIPPAHVVNLGVRIGSEQTITGAFSVLGLEPGDLKMRYYVTSEERSDALAWLRGNGVSESAYLVGVQQHGGWRAKKWAHTKALVARLQKEGKTVLLFGVDPKRSAQVDQSPNVIMAANMPMRLLFAVISLLDVMVGFDSGLCYGAAAVGTPLVTLWGPHNPKMMADSTAANFVGLRKRSPGQCESERGANCRSLHGGEKCPFRKNGRGGDCLDEITVAEVMTELDGMPKWDCPLSERLSQ